MDSEWVAGTPIANPYANVHRPYPNTFQVNSAPSSEPRHTSSGALSTMVNGYERLRTEWASSQTSVPTEQTCSKIRRQPPNTQAVPRSQFQAASLSQNVTGHPQNYADAFGPHSMTDLTKCLQVLHAEMTDNLIANIRREILSVRKSCDEVKDEVVSVKKDVKSIIEAHKIGLQGLSQKVDTLENFLGVSEVRQRGGKSRTLMGCLNEICLAFGEVFQKIHDLAADGLEEDQPPSSSESGIATGPLDLESQVTVPTTTRPLASTSQMGTGSSLSRSRSLDLANTGWQSISVHQPFNPEMSNLHEGCILSNASIEIRADPNNDTQPDMSQTPTLPQTSESLLVSNSKARSQSRKEPECSVSAIQKQSNTVLHGFSRVNWDEIGNQLPPGPSPQPSPSPSRGCSAMPFSLPVNLNDSTLTGSEKAPLIIAGGCRHGVQEAQHSSSALDLSPLPRQQMESCTPSQIGSCVLSKTVAKALVPASSPQQASSQTTYQTMERSFSQVPDVLPPEPPIQLEIPIEAGPTGRGDSHPLPHSPHIIYDVPSSLDHEVEAKIATQHGLDIETNQEVLDTEVSPLINALPELEYPMMDSEVEGVETYVDKVDPEKEDEGVGVLAEVTVIDRDEVEGLLANDTFEEEMDVLWKCVGEVSMYNEVDKSVMQQIRLDEEEVCVDFGKMPIPVQLQEEGGEEDKEEDEVEEEDCPSSPPSVYASPKASISSIKSQVDPHRRSPETLKSTRQPSIPQSLDQINIDMSSLHNPSEETVPIVAQLTTLSDSESESEVDELAPSEPRDSHKDLEEESTEGTCTIAKDQTVAAESSFQQENDSSETIGHGVGDVIVDEEELEYAEIQVDEPLLEIVDRTFSTQSHPVRQPEHLYSHNMQPTLVVPPVEVISITLPGDVSSVNTPSPGRFPTFSPVLDTRGGLSRKRKLEEINIGGTVEQSSLGSESQTLGDRIRSTKDASPSIVGCKQQDILPVSRGVSESRSRDENQEGRATELIVVERDGSPMYISSGSSSPTSNKIKVTRNDDFLECIDLTDSPPIVEKVQAGLVDVMKQEDGPSSSIQAPSIIYPEGTVRPRTKRERRRPKGWEKKRMIEAEKEIIDFGAEASDEPDIRPVRGLGLSNGVAEQASGDTNSANGSTTIPTTNLTAIRTRQEQNEKRSKATTRIKRRQRMNTNQNGSISPGLIEKEVSGSDRPSKRTRTELRDIDVKPVILSASAKQGKLATKEKSPNAAKEAATKQMQQLRTADVTQGSSNRIKWPLKKTGGMHNKNFISCDSCHAWYHNGCVGIRFGDVRLKETEIFACPFCLAGRNQESCQSPAGTCCRPDCPFKRATQEGEYFVKRIVGMRTKNGGHLKEYLVEWDGYPIEEATWEKEKFMTDPSQVVEAFFEAAEEEGLNLNSISDTSFLLRDAHAWRDGL